MKAKDDLSLERDKLGSGAIRTPLYPVHTDRPSDTAHIGKQGNASLKHIRIQRIKSLPVGLSIPYRGTVCGERARKRPFPR